MKSLIPSLRSTAVALALASTLVFGVAVGRATADQPHMQNAKAALETARTELELSEANKGGHRERAIDLVNQALAEVQAGIDFAR